MSTLNNPHSIAGDFNAAVFSFIKDQEGFVPRVYLDGKNIPTLGVGYALATRNNQTGLYELRSAAELAAKLGAMGISLIDDPQRIDDDMDILRAAVGALNGTPVPPGVPTIAHWSFQHPDPTNTSFSFGVITEPQFQPLFNLLVDDATTKLIAKIGQPTYSALAGSKEAVALLSLVFNSPSLIGTNLIHALQTGNRAEAWYQIRYESNKERITDPALARGIANRRYAESDGFGLYENTTLTDAEAKSIFQMYTEHRETIYTYEGNTRTSPATGESFASRASDARTTLLSLYSQKTEPFGPGTVLLPGIDGEVLVGNDDLRGDLFDVRLVNIPGVPAHVFDLSKNDLMFGEGGRDTLHGHGGSDVLYGGAAGDELYGEEGEDYLFGGDGEDSLQGGDQDDVLFGGADNDRLVGGKGDDKLAGGAGFDTYVYTTGDGHDRIEDSDARGVIIVNGQTLAGGVKKAGHTDWISADGTLKYVMQGTDLVVKLNDVTILTVNENFQSGQFNIKLIDEPTVSTQLPSTTRSIVGDFDPLDTDPAEPGIQIDYDELGNVLQDTASPNDRSDLLNGSAGNDTINGGAMNDRLMALGGNDIGICFWLG